MPAPLPHCAPPWWSARFLSNHVPMQISLVLYALVFYALMFCTSALYVALAVLCSSLAGYSCTCGLHSCAPCPCALCFRVTRPCVLRYIVRLDIGTQHPCTLRPCTLRRRTLCPGQLNPLLVHHSSQTYAAIILLLLFSQLLLLSLASFSSFIFHF